jgi:serine/threonine-protein kinase RsbW
MPPTSGTPDRASGVPQAPSGSADRLRWRQLFPGEERHLGALRRWLASLFPPCPARDDVTAVASELSSNAVRHTLSGRGGWFAVEVTWYGPVVRVAVTDSGAPTEPRVIDDPGSEHGRGLLVVRGLSLRAGACGDHRGRLVWADVRWDAGAVVAVAAPDAHEAAIRDGEAALARRFAGVPAWFGRDTLAWWALAEPGQLVTAPSARELAGLLPSDQRR